MPYSTTTQQIMLIHSKYIYIEINILLCVFCHVNGNVQDLPHHSHCIKMKIYAQGNHTTRTRFTDMDKETKYRFTVAEHWAQLIIEREDPHIDAKDDTCIKLNDRELIAVASRLMAVPTSDRTDGDRLVLTKLRSVESIKATCGCDSSLFGRRCGSTWCEVRHCSKCVCACITPRPSKRKRESELNNDKEKEPEARKAATKKRRRKANPQ